MPILHSQDGRRTQVSWGPPQWQSCTPNVSPQFMGVGSVGSTLCIIIPPPYGGGIYPLNPSRFLANWPNRLTLGLEILINEPTLARNRSISSRGTQICPNIRRPRSGRLIFSHIQVPLELIDGFLAKVGSFVRISSPEFSRFSQSAKNWLKLAPQTPPFF